MASLPPITLRPATRADLPTLTHIANDANAKSALHNRMARYNASNPSSYHIWRHLTMRIRFVRSDLRYIVACDLTTGSVLGFGIWAAEGDSALLERWKAERRGRWADWMEGQLLRVENVYNRYVSDKSIDWPWLDEFHAQAHASSSSTARPPCLHLWLLCVDPAVQSKGVGRRIMEWGWDLAREEGLPVFLESNLEAVGFYRKLNGREMWGMVLFAETDEQFRIPAFAWEGGEQEGKEGKRLKREGEREGRELWTWKSEIDA